MKKIVLSTIIAVAAYAAKQGMFKPAVDKVKAVPAFAKAIDKVKNLRSPAANDDRMMEDQTRVA